MSAISKERSQKLYLTSFQRERHQNNGAIYALAKCVVNLHSKGTTRIGRCQRGKSYINDRNPERATFFSDAKKKAGKNCILSKLH